ncbi:mevalonate kinase [Danaus plexippus plexippus]|uniref:Mevalonate kinase n=1 Tax=Danaus plexippus plexippus TaxID=278856 RepID=A0A212FMY0_DANPL|nr:mevalonate kinase [Danaus plexippus plexippus]OWR55101.1 mevalonate kinase [Danaus plexippus plexippus]
MDLCKVKVTAPGKVILHGEHSVLYGEIAVACSIGLKTTTVIQEVKAINEPSINIIFLSLGLNESIPLKKVVDYFFEPPFSKSWKNHIEVDHASHLAKVDLFWNTIKPNFEKFSEVQKQSLRSFLYLFSKIFAHTDLLKNSMSVKMTTELTIGAGTGSSASFAVCLAAAFLQFLKVKCGCNDKIFHLEDLERISAEAFESEKIMHGTPSGIDNTTCTFGSLVAYKKGGTPRLLDFKTNIRILLVDTKVSRNTKRLVSHVSALKDRNSNAVDCVMMACGHVTTTAIKILEELAQDGVKDTEEKYRHLADLWNMNHCLLASLGVSHPALEDIRASAAVYGFGCKLTGAGGGGHAIVLLPPSSDQTTIDSLIADLKNKGYAVKDTHLGSDGVSLEM